MPRLLRSRERITYEFDPATSRDYDVGANWGHWTRDALLVFPDASFVLFEPQDHLREHVSDLLARGDKVVWRPIGLSDRKGEALFTFRERDDSSSFNMTEDQAHAAGLRQAKIEISTIDSIVEESGGAAPDLIKIDAEGLDLQVLAGARKTLESTDVVLVEGGVMAGIENSLVKVCAWMDEAGFQLAQITDLNNSGNNHLLYLVEMAFIRRKSDFFAKADKSF